MLTDTSLKGHQTIAAFCRLDGIDKYSLDRLEGEGLQVLLADVLETYFQTGDMDREGQNTANETIHKIIVSQMEQTEKMPFATLVHRIIGVLEREWNMVGL